MVRCGCATDRCNCTIIAGDGVEVTGNGSDNSPFVVSAVVPEAGGGGGTRFSGEIVAYAGPVAPVGWALCDGSEVSRSVYSALFAVIGIAYGAGDGTTTFNLPNLTGRFPLGVDGSFPRGQSGGSDVLSDLNLPEHTHPIDHDHASANTTANGSHDHNLEYATAVGTTGSTVPLGTGTLDRVSDAAVQHAPNHSHSVDLPAYTGDSGTAGSVDPDPFLPPYQAVNYIIKG